MCARHSPPSPMILHLLLYDVCYYVITPSVIVSYTRSRRLSHAIHCLSDETRRLPYVTRRLLYVTGCLSYATRWVVYLITDLPVVWCLHAHNVVYDLISNKSFRRHRPIKFLTRVVGYEFFTLYEMSDVFISLLI